MSIDFTEKDIVAIEVTSPGYQTYQGNMVVEQADSRELRHAVRLTRTLTLLSVRLGAMDSLCELRPVGDAGKTIRLQPIPGLPNTLVASDLLPRQYTLVILDKQHRLKQQRPVAINAGLNVLVFSAVSVRSKAADYADHFTAMPLDRPDSALRFEQGSYTLRPASADLLTRMAAYLEQHPEVSIRIAGHTDKEGNEQLNRQLSEFRAKVVSTFLGQRGVADSRMEIIGLGSRYLIAPSDVEENKAKNRRVTITFLTR